MSRDSSGNCTRTKTGGYVAGQDILASEVNSEIDDIIVMLTDSLSRSGKGGATENIAMGGYKITGLAAATATGEAVRYDELTSGLATKAAKGANTDITSLASPYIAGATADTQTAGNNTTKVATTAFVTTAVTNGVSSKANDSAVVHNTGNESVAGVKTFSSNPVANNIPKFVGKITNCSSATPTYTGEGSISVSRVAAGRYTITCSGISTITSASLIGADSTSAAQPTITNITGAAFSVTFTNGAGSANVDPDICIFITVYGA